MQVPIMPNSYDQYRSKETPKAQKTDLPLDYGMLDLSDVSKLIEQRSRSNNSIVKVSNGDAGLLFNLWKDSNVNNPEDIIQVPDTLSNTDILRLKASGLISGDQSKVKFTSRGREVIVNMVLGEQNSFDKKASKKEYNQIVKDSRLTGGPRLSVGNKT